MATQAKRKYSFGLISRLALIGAFVGLGSWAVFNSQFKGKGDEEVAQNDEELEEEPKADQPESESTDNKKVLSNLDDQKKASDTEKSNSPKTVPATFVEKQKPAKIKLADNKKQPSKNSESSISSGFKAVPAKKASGPPTSTFSPSNSFGPPGKKDSVTDSGQFTPPKSESFAGASKKSGPPSSTFDPTGSLGSPKKSPSKSLAGKNKSDANRFSLVGSTPDKKTPSLNSLKSKSDPLPGKNNPSEKSVPANSFAKNSPKSGPPSSTFNPQGDFSPSTSRSSAASKSSPPSNTFNPTGSFKSEPGKNQGMTEVTKSSGFSGGSFGDSANRNNATSSDSGSGFQARPSTGQERPLRGNAAAKKQSDPPRPNSTFSLGSDTQNKSGIGLGSTKQPTKATFSNQGSGAFQDKGSKPLKRNNVPSNGLVQGNSKSSAGSSSSGFGDIGKPNLENRSTDPANGGSLNATQKLGPNSVSAKSNLTPRSVSSSSLSNSSNAGSSNPVSRTKFASNPNLGGNPVSGAKDNQPGPSSLEGIQAPAVTLQKVSPREIQVNVESEFKLIVRNVGRANATNITVVDPIPAGTEFVSSSPPPTKRGTDGSLIWQFGSIAPNQQQIITVNLLPKRQGEIGSVARMSFQSAATAKSICTKPEISLTHKGPQKVLKGQNAKFLVTVKNNGDGMARNVSVEDEVPEGFVFGNGKGKRLAYLVGNLAPGASRDVLLTLRAEVPGRYVNEVRAKMGKTITASHKLGVEVVAPQLEIKIVGPTRRYIQREANYQVEVSNSGSAAAKNVLIVTRLPRGMRFVGTNNRGQYNAREHSVYWSMVELSPQNKGTVDLKLMPTGTGQQDIQFEARSILDRTKLEKFPVLVDQLAELFFEVDDRDDPIEVNGETEYRVRVVNQGSKAATNVLLNIEMPGGIQAIKSDGPTKSQVKGQLVSFAPVANLAPRGELIYKVKAKGLRDGDHLIKVLLSSNERREAVAKQESTKVYSEYR